MRKHGDAKKYNAHVIHVGHECDIAMVTKTVLLVVAVITFYYYYYYYYWGNKRSPQS